MAKFIVTMNAGKYEVFLEGGNGDEITPEMAMAYAHMKVASSIEGVADQLAEINATLADLKGLLPG